MNNIGVLSNSSAFTNSSYSVYGTTLVNSPKSEQQLSDAKNAETKAKPLDELEDQAIISLNAMKLAQIDRISAQIEQKMELEKQARGESQKTQMTQNNEEGLTPEQQKQVEELKAIDSEVKSHERAHVAASGGIGASAPTYTYQKGPDGQNYAVAGQVRIKTSGSSTAEETIADAKAMEAAALAPGNPSAQDMKVASNASRIISEAKEEKNSATQEETNSPLAS